jgi:DNA-binding IclR family transcriptional regulator
MTVPTVLLTLDEARSVLGASAIDLVDTVTCSPARLRRLLTGKGTSRGLAPPSRQAISAHRAVLRRVIAAGHGWILEEQAEGALSYAESCRHPAGELAA